MFSEQAQDPALPSAIQPRSGSGEPLIVVVTGNVRDHLRRAGRSLTKDRGFVLVHCQDSIDEATRYCRRLAPCVWLLEREDLVKLDPSQFSSLVDFGRAIQVLVWISGEEPDSALEPLLRLGCMGFLRQDASPASIRKAVRAVASGEYWTTRKLATRMLQRYFAAEGPQKLTKRESEILQLIAKGYRNRDIAERLFISRETVRWHLRSLYSKIGVQDRIAGPPPGTGASPVAAPRPVKKPVVRQSASPPSAAHPSGAPPRKGRNAGAP